jgi:hypothetical protein
MLRTTLFASLLLTAACLDEGTATEDSAVQGDGKADSWAVAAETHVLDETRSPEHEMQDGSFVYYTLFTPADEENNPQTRSVMRVRRSTGVAEKIATIVGYPYYAALGGSFIYFANDNGVYKLPKAGGVAQLVVPITSTNALAADPSGVYIAAATYEADQYFHRISKVATGSTTPVELARATYVTSLAVDSTHVYWLDETQPNPAIGCGRFAGEAHKVSKAGGADITLTVGINCPLGLAVDGTSLYYSNWAQTDGGNPVVKLSKYGGFPQVIGRTSGMQIVVDASYAYWISTAGDLVRTAKTFILPRTIAANVNHAIVGADAAGVYFWREQGEEIRTYSLYRIGQ